ncbi:hypothetical protein KPL35_15950 [Clostridium sp. CF011]|nr:hypothetical protein [Clostridium sp. CF011]MBU3093552.1 hypothetical protein [Clostridium sp. CF011]
MIYKTFNPLAISAALANGQEMELLHSNIIKGCGECLKLCTKNTKI